MKYAAFLALSVAFCHAQSSLCWIWNWTAFWIFLFLSDVF